MYNINDAFTGEDKIKERIDTVDLVCTKNNSNKFYQMIYGMGYDGKYYLLRKYGARRLGGNISPKEVIMDFKSEMAAKHWFDAKIKEELSKGYYVADVEDVLGYYK